MVNTKRVVLNFEVKDIGPSGVAGIDLWHTRDGRNWDKLVATLQGSAYAVDVADEGMHGFTLLARSGVGLARKSPQPGDQPQVWVIVDTTAPALKLTNVNPTVQGTQRTVVVQWEARDKNLGGRPISLLYAEQEGGPWRPIALPLENTGEYVWQVPVETRSRVMLRLEATDLAGNVSQVQTPAALLLDTSQPQASITSVDVDGRK
jgi:hypothetical protein